jgi:hypothetical protein
VQNKETYSESSPQPQGGLPVLRMGPKMKRRLVWLMILIVGMWTIGSLPWDPRTKIGAGVALFILATLAANALIRG